MTNSYLSEGWPNHQPVIILIIIIIMVMIILIVIVIIITRIIIIIVIIITTIIIIIKKFRVSPAPWPSQALRAAHAFAALGLSRQEAIAAVPGAGKTAAEAEDRGITGEDGGCHARTYKNPQKPTKTHKNRQKTEF